VFSITAFDQAGNQQAALWNVNDVDETEKEVIFGLQITNVNTMVSLFDSVKNFSLYQLMEVGRCIP
jgi:hypothetical protein